MKYVIHGATGAQGSPLFNKLREAGKNAVAAVRNPGKLSDLLAVAIDNASVESLAAAYKDAAGVFVHLPLGSEEQRLQYARNIARAVGIARPGRMVISTSGWVVDAPGTPLQSPDNSAVPILIREVERTGVPTAAIAPRTVARWLGEMRV
jgi:uncharacterized protein YbjT (DUF2867 family)